MKNSQQADNHVLRNYEALNGWFDLEEAQHQKTHEGLGLDPPTPIHPFLFNFNIKVGFNARLLIIV